MSHATCGCRQGGTSSGRKAESQARRSASRGAIGRTATPMARNLKPAHGGGPLRSSRRAISSKAANRKRFLGRCRSRSASVSASRERRRAAGGMPPRGNNTERMQLCGLSKARPIACSDCPAFHRLQTSRFSIAESPNRCPALMPTPPLHSRLTSDGVASTRRMHRVNQELRPKLLLWQVVSAVRNETNRDERSWRVVWV